jgi:hypothetical protein
MAPIGFKERARRHQIKFREEILRAGKGEQEYYLSDADALRGSIFFEGLGILQAAQKRYPNFANKKACFANMLRSEHIPFNFFVPLSKDLGYARDVINKFMGGIITEITVITIEYAPDRERALKDYTSFDAYVEYIHVDGSKGVLGIEVKYTEHGYPLEMGSPEAIAIDKPDSRYNTITDKIGLYRKEIIQRGVLKTDEFRQVWRNQLLGESMTRKNHPESEYVHFTSIILYPSGNDHFRKLIPEYKSFLTPGHESSFMGITYEEFMKTARELTTDPEYLRWLQYLEDRYIVKG